MRHHRNAEFTCFFQCFPHHAAAGHRHAVVRYGDCSGIIQRPEITHLLPCQPPAHRCNRINTHAVGLAGLIQNEIRNSRVIVDRRGIGHGADRRKPAVGCGPASALDGFLILETRFPEVDVNIHETGAYNTAVAVDNFYIF